MEFHDAVDYGEESLDLLTPLSKLTGQYEGSSE